VRVLLGEALRGGQGAFALRRRPGRAVIVVVLTWTSRSSAAAAPVCACGGEPVWVRSRIRSRSNSGERAEDVKDKAPPGVVVSIRLLEAAEADAALFEVADSVDQVPEAASEPIELPDDERVGGLEVVERGPLGDWAAGGR
jgi:hypothetical protein